MRDAAGLHGAAVAHAAARPGPGAAEAETVQTLLVSAPGECHGLPLVPAINIRDTQIFYLNPFYLKKTCIFFSNHTVNCVCELYKVFF